MIFFRVDASVEIGAGHVMRCLSLAESLRGCGKQVSFICMRNEGDLIKKIHNDGFDVHIIKLEKVGRLSVSIWKNTVQVNDAKKCIKIFEKYQVEWLIVDHYGLDKTWEDDVKEYVNKVMVIDDMFNRKHNCEILLDQNYNNNKDRYKDLIPLNAITLMGPKYALLRKEFQNIKGRKKNKGIKKIFIFFGGSDPYNLTLLALKALNQENMKSLLVDIVIGSANPYRSGIESYIEKCPNYTLHVQINNIAVLMSRSDFAIGAGGVATLERMAVGLPSIVITTAKNQIPSIKSLDHKYVNWIGGVETVSEELIRSTLEKLISDPNKSYQQSIKGQTLLNEIGTDEVCNLLINGPNVKGLTLRVAQKKDCELYWHWVNDPATRKSSIDQKFITWEVHKAWFSNKMADSNATLLLIESRFGPVGQVRFDKDREVSYSIDYSVSPVFRGFGLGALILIKSIKFFEKMNRDFVLVANVKSTNIASIKIFKQLKFCKSSSDKDNFVRFSLKKC